MDDQIRELVAIATAITEGFEKVAQEIAEANREQTNALLEMSEVTREGFEKLTKEVQKMRHNIYS